jgi:cytochrome c5
MMAVDRPVRRQGNSGTCSKRRIRRDYVYPDFHYWGEKAMRNLGIVLAMMLMVLLVASCGESSEPASSEAPTTETPTAEAAKVEAPDGAALLKASCVSCHGLEKVEGYKGKMPWKDIVAKMAAKDGAKIDEADIPKIVACLEKMYPQK